jgi:hypothetical protein
MILANLLRVKVRSQDGGIVSFRLIPWYHYITERKKLVLKVKPDYVFANFVSLTRVSKQARANAIQVLFTINRVMLYIKGRIWDIWDIESYEIQNDETIIEESLGREALRNIRDLHLEIWNDCVESHHRVAEQVCKIVEVLKEARGLRRLVITWCYSYRTETDWWPCYDKRQMHMDGKRSFSDRDNNRVSVWEKRENILEPFKSLQGIREVFVTGNVSDEYARYLEECMGAKSNIVPDFHRDMYGPSTEKSVAKEFEARRIQERVFIHKSLFKAFRRS